MEFMTYYCYIFSVIMQCLNVNLKCKIRDTNEMQLVLFKCYLEPGVRNTRLLDIKLISSFCFISHLTFCSAVAVSCCKRVVMLERLCSKADTT